jgi:hypothetical protein
VGRKVLITGSNSGFGWLTTNTLLGAGHTVVASMRDPQGRNKSGADELAAKGAKVVDIDVTQDASVEAGVAKAMELAGGIDVLVNNAGVGVIGLQEAFTIDDWKKVIVDPGGFGTDFGSRLMQAGDTARTKTYGDMAKGPEQQMASFEQNYASDNAPNPQMVADAILKVIDTPRGQRPFRTVVDGMGMGAPIEAINKASHEATTNIYSAFGMEGMLKIQA